MAVLKYWSAEADRWVPVGGLSGTPDVLPVAGGTISGSLVVTGDVDVYAQVKARMVGGSRPDSVFDGNIRLRGRSVSLAGARMAQVGDPVDDDDAVNLRYLQQTTFEAPAHMVLAPYSGWSSPGPDYGPAVLHQAPDGLVRFSGSLVATRPLQPGSGTLLTVLPTAVTSGVKVRPSGRRVFLVAGTMPHFQHQVHVEPNGEVALMHAPPEMPVGYRVSLDSVAYYPG